jgi:hypothetical protein
MWLTKKSGEQYHLQQPQKTKQNKTNLGIHLTKEVKDLYSESYKSLKKEIKDDYRRWKDLLCSWIG